MRAKQTTNNKLPWATANTSENTRETKKLTTLGPTYAMHASDKKRPMEGDEAADADDNVC